MDSEMPMTITEDEPVRHHRQVNLEDAKQFHAENINEDHLKEAQAIFGSSDSEPEM